VFFKEEFAGPPRRPTAPLFSLGRGRIILRDRRRFAALRRRFFAPSAPRTDVLRLLRSRSAAGGGRSTVREYPGGFSLRDFPFNERVRGKSVLRLAWDSNKQVIRCSAGPASVRRKIDQPRASRYGPLRAPACSVVGIISALAEPTILVNGPGRGPLAGRGIHPARWVPSSYNSRWVFSSYMTGRPNRGDHRAAVRISQKAEQEASVRGNHK